jgi:hypothetical protein
VQFMIGMYVLQASLLPSGEPLQFRFVRHLPVSRDRSARDLGLRAGVGQTSGEETAAHGAVVVEGTELWRFDVVALLVLRVWPPADGLEWSGTGVRALALVAGML